MLANPNHWGPRWRSPGATQEAITAMRNSPIGCETLLEEPMQHEWEPSRCGAQLALGALMDLPDSPVLPAVGLEEFSHLVWAESGNAASPKAEARSLLEDVQVKAKWDLSILWRRFLAFLDGKGKALVFAFFMAQAGGAGALAALVKILKSGPDPSKTSISLFVLSVSLAAAMLVVGIMLIPGVLVTSVDRFTSYLDLGGDKSLTATRKLLAQEDSLGYAIVGSALLGLGAKSRKPMDHDKWTSIARELAKHNADDRALMILTLCIASPSPCTWDAIGLGQGPLVIQTEEDPLYFTSKLGAVKKFFRRNTSQDGTLKNGLLSAPVGQDLLLQPIAQSMKNARTLFKRWIFSENANLQRAGLRGLDWCAHYDGLESKGLGRYTPAAWKGKSARKSGKQVIDSLVGQAVKTGLEEIHLQ